MRTLIFLIAFSSICAASGAADKPPATVEDCVRVRQPITPGNAPNDIAMSPSGQYVAYVLKVSDFKTNANQYQLRLRDLNRVAEREHGSLLFQANELSGATWLADGRHLALLSRNLNRSTIVLIDIITGHKESIVENAERIWEYSI